MAISSMQRRLWMVIYSMNNQRQQILSYIDEFNSISPLEALRDLGIMRLSARVWDIEHIDGIKLKKRMESAKNRYGKPISYARYYREVQDERLDKST